MKNKLLIILLSAFLSIQISALATDLSLQNSSVVSQGVEETLITQQLDEDVDDIKENKLADSNSPYKTPISKRKIVKKFLMAMFGVIISSLTLYFGLTLYNKVRNGVLNKEQPSDGDTSLETPYDMESAVKSFLDKTGW